VPTGLIVLALTVVVITWVISASESAPATPETESPEPQERDYSKFKHDDPNHARLPCLLCHRRETNSPLPTLPGSNGHLPCAGCHTRQFASSSGPMCTICHTEVQAGKLKAFPRLISFNMRFDHARHTRMGNLGCANCHRPSRGGVALSIPAGFSAHTTCFGCHTPMAKSGEKDISSCGVCHQPGRQQRMPTTAVAFRVGFSHAKHDRSEGLNCNECHRVRAGVARQLQVSAPQPLNHHASPGALSCMSCHNGKRAFGGDDFSVCKRCHTGNAWHF
jgi:c(7)-type cytochrome triheme protein